jgi:hypothetical protein
MALSAEQLPLDPEGPVFAHCRKTPQGRETPYPYRSRGQFRPVGSLSGSPHAALREPWPEFNLDTCCETPSVQQPVVGRKAVIVRDRSALTMIRIARDSTRAGKIPNGKYVYRLSHYLLNSTSAIAIPLSPATAYRR